VSLTLENTTIDVILQKLDSIESKVNREIHGGNGKGLWEETKEIRERLDEVDSNVQELAISVTKHTGKHLGKDSQVDERRAITGIKLGIFGLLVSSVTMLVAVLRLAALYGG